MFYILSGSAGGGRHGGINVTGLELIVIIIHKATVRVYNFQSLIDDARNKVTEMKRDRQTIQTFLPKGDLHVKPNEPHK